MEPNGTPPAPTLYGALATENQAGLMGPGDVALLRTSGAWVSSLVDFTIAPQHVVIDPPGTVNGAKAPLLVHCFFVFDGVNDGAGTVNAAPKISVGNNESADLFDNLVRAQTLDAPTLQKPITDGATYIVASFAPVDPTTAPPPFVLPLDGHPVTLKVLNPATGVGLTCKMRVVLALAFL